MVTFEQSSTDHGLPGVHTPIHLLTHLRSFLAISQDTSSSGLIVDLLII
jgi:hypothetical protein